MRDKNYAAFYVSEPFDECSLGAHATKDFVYYNMLRAWKGNDSSFPFKNAHDTTYSVRDSSDWETTLKPRIRERIRNSKNVILFLSSLTKSSGAIREEIDYAINSQQLPIIVVYPDFTEKSDIINCNLNVINKKITDLWDNLPIFRDSMKAVPIIHIPNKKDLIKAALNDPDFMLDTKCKAGHYFYKC
ncbi:TIR domain-containing protein [Flavobacterium sp. XN-5]|uniref:TIR domain-containing protein n=1 Tax=Flavobacterium sp. XN-5 TaxID=2599390 RepID=UPI001ADDD0BD|nr:TIR domain-containing protein [Flavobacterium sp. XN-5]